MYFVVSMFKRILFSVVLIPSFALSYIFLGRFFTEYDDEEISGLVEKINALKWKIYARDKAFKELSQVSLLIANDCRGRLSDKVDINEIEKQFCLKFISVIHLIPRSFHCIKTAEQVRIVMKESSEALCLHHQAEGFLPSNQYSKNFKLDGSCNISSHIGLFRDIMFNVKTP